MSLNVRRVLCAVDFSDCSGRALYAAAAFARRHNAHLRTVHVHPLPPSARPRAVAEAAAKADEKSRPLIAAGPSVATGRFDSSLESIERGQLDAALRHLVTLETGIVHPDAVVEEACDVSAALLARAAQEHADLIVLGTHRRHALQRFMLGSVAEKVLRRAPCAVLMVPPAAPRDASPSLGRILCALDFADGLVALEHARDLAEAAATQLTILHVIQLPAAGPDMSEAELAGYRAARFEYARECMKASLADVRGRCDAKELLLVGTPEQEIIRVATEQESDLIVLGIHPRSAADLALFGSVTHHVVRHAPCLVLTVRGEEA